MSTSIVSYCTYMSMLFYVYRRDTLHASLIGYLISRRDIISMYTGVTENMPSHGDSK